MVKLLNWPSARCCTLAPSASTTVNSVRNRQSASQGKRSKKREPGVSTLGAATIDPAFVETIVVRAPQPAVQLSKCHHGGKFRGAGDRRRLATAPRLSPQSLLPGGHLGDFSALGDDDLVRQNLEVGVVAVAGFDRG